MIIEGKFNEILGWLHAYVAEKYPSNANTVSNMYKALQTAPEDFVQHIEADPSVTVTVVEEALDEPEVEDDGEPDEEEVEDQDQTE